MFCLKIAAGEGRVKRWTARNGSGVGLEWMGADGQRGEFEWLARNVAAVPLGRGTFAYRSGRRLVFFGNQQFAQCVNVAAQHRQGTIPLKANFALVATTDESVARLQGANCRLDARVTLSGLMK